MTEFNTIHWLPKHLTRMKEWQEICNAYDYLLSQAWGTLDDLHCNMSIYDLTEAGCEMWESLLGITPNKTDTLEERRHRIQMQWTQDLPYTLTKLREKLEAICGDNVAVTVTHETYTINVELTISDPSAIESTQEVVYRMRPANMVVHIKIIYKKPEPTYVGMAYKSTKAVTPTDKEPIDPMGDVTMFVYGDDLLTDSYKNPLKDAKET